MHCCQGASKPQNIPRLCLCSPICSSSASFVNCGAICELTRKLNVLGQLSHVCGIGLVRDLSQLIAKRIRYTAVDVNELARIVESRGIDIDHLKLVHLFNLLVKHFQPVDRQGKLFSCALGHFGHKIVHF